MSLKTIAAAVALAGAFLLGASAANAQATRTWISGVGDDANPCSRTAPCKTFAGAISKTAPGGEIDCLDPGGFGAVTITKAITLDCASGSGGQVGSILVAGTNGITVSAGAADTVILRNLSINGIAASGSPGLSAVRFNTGASLTIDHVNVLDIGSSTYPAIWFNPSAAGGKLVIHDTNVTDSHADGIVVQGQGGVATSAVIDHSTVTHGTANGIRAYDGATVTVSNSVSAFNASKGAFADSAASGPVVLSLSHDVIASNVGQGVVALGSGATATLDNDTIVNNANVGVETLTGGTINTLSNNTVTGNTGTNATATVVAPY